MSAWYLLSGSIRLRRCPEVEAILDELRDIRGDEFEVIAMPTVPGEIEVTFDGGSEFTDEGAAELDSMLRRSAPGPWRRPPSGESTTVSLRVVIADPVGESDHSDVSISRWIEAR